MSEGGKRERGSEGGMRGGRNRRGNESGRGDE